VGLREVGCVDERWLEVSCPVARGVEPSDAVVTCMSTADVSSLYYRYQMCRVPR
jgi:hypothetical protein